MAVRKIAAIHQPNFFPWLSYFDKIIKSDVFVILDNVQFQKKGGTWSNRVRMLINKQADWITMPVIRSYHGLKQINEIEIDNSKPWKEKFIKTIETNYGRAPYFDSIYPELKTMLENSDEKLASFNVRCISKLSEMLHIRTTEFIKASELKASGNANELLIEIVKETGSNVYLYGKGARNYQDNDKFKDAGIEIVYQDFNQPIYMQFSSKEFIPGLSILDALMNIGFDGVRKLLENSSNEPSKNI
jgi:WbqC-like protein